MFEHFIAQCRLLLTVPQDNPRLLQAQYVALSRQIPLMYFILLVNTWALAATHYDSAPAWLTVLVPLVLTVVCSFRTRGWLRSVKAPISAEAVLKTLLRTNRLVAVIALAFTGWSLALYPYGNAYAQAHVAFYMAITVIGCIFCLMHLRSAAMTTAAVVNIAFVIFFASTHNPTFIATAINILLVSIAMLVILQNHYRDFTRLVNAQAQTERLSNENLYLANQDSLTGLPNRRQFFSVLDAELAEALASGARLAVGIIDLDGFKPVNDLYGHSVGDKLLVQVGQRLRAHLRANVHLARLGGDEFALVITGVASNAQLTEMGLELCAELRKPFMITDVPIQIGGSLGVATFPDVAANATEIYEYADYALYQSKRHSRGGPSFFSSVHLAQLQEEMMTEQALRRADLEAEFSVVFQPIIDIHTGHTVSFEALARWACPDLGHVSPALFIPIAERIGFINRLTLPLLSKALRAANTWPAHIRLSFNLSAHDCGSGEAARLICEAIRSSGFDPCRLDLEITETAVMQDISQVQRAIGLFRQMGCGISLDDFGTGYSSLSQLHALALTKLKIDRSFVTDLHRIPASYKIVKSLVALSQDMALECIIEGVETEEELQALKGIGCRWVQGYFFSKPLPFAQTESWLARGHPL